MSIRKIIAASLLGAGLALASTGHAATLFTDNFDGDSASTQLNFTGLTNWTVSGGAIDYIRSGGYGISCVGGSGGCLDMDGSTGVAGRITSVATFSITAGVAYSFTGQVSGNQRGGASDSITFGLIDAVTNAFLGSGTTSGILASDPFSTTGLWFVMSTDHVVRLYVETAGGDNIGPILDNVAFSDDRTAAVSEPGTTMLAGLGLLAAAVLRRRAR